MRWNVQALTTAFGASVVFGILVAVSTPPLPTLSAAEPPPLTLSTTVAAPGETVTIRGTGWPASQKLQAAVCGGGAQTTSQDCDLAHEVESISTNTGLVGLPLVVTIPPVPCPCVVLVTALDPFALRALPITIVGASTAPVHPPAAPRRQVTISHVHIVSKGSWTSWFGAAAPRELVLTVHNGAPYPVLPLLVAHVVQGSHNFPITSPTPKPLPIGGTSRITAPFSLSTFAHGDFSVVGMVTEGNYEEGFVSDEFALPTSTTPWALYGIGIILGAGVLAVVVAAVLRRRGGEKHPSEPVDPKTRDDDPTPHLTPTGAAR
jgi:hypothetical protein